LDTWNVTLSNTSALFTIDVWNITLSNTTIDTILDTWNITLSNTSALFIIDTWNITLSNTSIYTTIDTWNITLSNTTQYTILDTWNVTLSNTSIPHIIDTWNITLSNTSIGVEFTFYNIYPEDNAIDICPCIDALCIGVNNSDNHNMNLTFWHRTEVDDHYHHIQSYYNVSNGKYCFCTCGHEFTPAYINWHDNGIQLASVAETWYNITFNESIEHPIDNINHTWDDSTNDTFTILYDGIYNTRFQMYFVDTAVNPTSVIEGRVTRNDAEVHGSLVSVETHKQDKLEFIGSSTLERFYKGDEIKLQFVASANSVQLQSHIHYGDSPYSSMIWIERIDDQAQEPMEYNQTYEWYVNVTDVITGDTENSDTFTFTTATDPDDCLPDPSISVPIDTGLSMGIMGGILGGIIAALILIKKRRERKR